MNSQDVNSPVDRELAPQHLSLANRHVAEGQERIEAQIALMVKLERDGHDIVQAKSLLHQFERTLALQIQTRDRILQELGEDG